jgi:hypothetical protein
MKTHFKSLPKASASGITIGLLTVYAIDTYAIDQNRTIKLESVPSMKYYQFIVHYPDGSYKVCWKCGGLGQECYDPEHTTICN